MDFALDSTTEAMLGRVGEFMDELVYPGEPLFHEQAAAAANVWDTPPLIEELKAEANSRGLWNLFLPSPHEGGAGLTNLQYAPLCELMGRSPWIAPESFNCSAPDTGNMELLSMFATDEQREQWLEPLLRGEIRSGFAMTEPAMASSDASNIGTTIKREGGEYVIDGVKWWTTGAMSPRCRLLVVMGVTNPDAARHARQSMVLVPIDTDGVDVRRGMRVFNYDDGPHGGHAEIAFDGVRVPASNLLGSEGEGFHLAQERLGPGRVHHAMRAIGLAQRALEMMMDRVSERVAFGRPLADQGVVREWVAESRIRIEQARLLVLKTAWLLDTAGKREARFEISAIKVAAADLATWVTDRAIQAFGAAGLSQDQPLAELYAIARTLHLVDGPDEVHRMAIGREALRASQK